MIARWIRRILLRLSRNRSETLHYARAWHEEGMVHYRQWLATGNALDRFLAISNALRACNTALRAQFGSHVDIIFYVVEHDLVTDDLAAGLRQLQALRDRLIDNHRAPVMTDDVHAALRLSHDVAVRVDL